MHRLTIAALALAASCATTALAAPACTAEPKEKWLTEDAMKAKVKELGYTIALFQVSGPCYEIYGKNKDGKSVEVYFNPVTGAIVKEENH